MVSNKRAEKLLVRNLLFIPVLILAAGLAVFSREAMEAARESVKVCLEVIVPSLFPFLVVSSLFVNLGFASFAGNATEGLMRRLFGVNGACAPALVLGLIGGYPVGVKTAVGLYEKGLCTKDEAERLLAFCNNSGPAFILGAIGGGIFKSAACGFLLFATHVVSALTVGFLFRRSGKNVIIKSARNTAVFADASFAEVFIDSVKNGFASVLNICAFVIFFAVLIRLLSVLHIFGPLSSGLGALLSPISIDSTVCRSLAAGFFEMTSGLWSLAASAASLPQKLAAAAFMLAFAGLSVHCQSFSLLAGTDLNKKPYLAGKTLHGLIAALYTYFAALFLMPAVKSFTPSNSIDGFILIDSKGLLVFYFAWCAVLCLLMLLPAFIASIKKRFPKRTN